MMFRPPVCYSFRGRQAAFLLVALLALLAVAPMAQAVAAEPVSPHLATADLAVGKKEARKCRACHTLDRKAAVRFGPPLWNIVNRPVATIKGFAYSKSMKKLGGIWDYERLNAFLSDPNSVAPKSRMRFTGIKELSERAALILYLRSLSDAPAPLPESAKEEAAAPAVEKEEEDFGELPPGPGREEVFYLCNACHSLRLVYQQGLSRDSWDETIEWMITKQGMPRLEPDERKLIVDYLAAHYGIPKGPRPFTPMSAPPLAPPLPK